MTMIILVAALVTALVMAMLFLLLYAARRPQMQTRQHLERMIAEAEAERSAARQQKRRSAAVETGVVSDYHYMREQSFKERIIRPVMKGLENWLMRFAPRELRNMMENMLLHLGMQEQWSVNRLAAGWVLWVVAGGIFALLFISAFSPLLLPQLFSTFHFVGLFSSSKSTAISVMACVLPLSKVWIRCFLFMPKLVPKRLS
jgi:tight adherence protein C